MVNRIKLTLEQPEYSALLEIARVELRSPDDQVRYMLRQQFERMGLLEERNQPVLAGQEGNHADRR